MEKKKRKAIKTRGIRKARVEREGSDETFVQSKSLKPFANFSVSRLSYSVLLAESSL